MHVLQFLACFSRNMRGRSRALVPASCSSQERSCLAHAQSDARNTYISCQFQCPALGWLWVAFLRMYVVLTLHLLHMQFMHSHRLHGPSWNWTLFSFYNQPGHSPRCLPWLVFWCQFHGSWRGSERTLYTRLLPHDPERLPREHRGGESRISPCSGHVPSVPFAVPLPCFCHVQDCMVETYLTC